MCCVWRQVGNKMMSEEGRATTDHIGEREEKRTFSRRRFLEVGFYSTAATSLVTLSGIIARFLIGNSLDEEEGKWVVLGNVNDLLPGTVHKINYSVRTTDAWRKFDRIGTLYAFSDNSTDFIVLDGTCTHLGCLVHWKAEENLFSCPCHEGIFTRQGAVVSGAPSKPLSRLQTKVEDGVLFALV